MPSRAQRPAEVTESSELRLRSFDSDLRLQTVTDIARALSARLSQNQLLDLIMERLTRALDGERSTLFLPSEDGREMWSKVAQGQQVQEIRIPIGQGIAGWVAATGRGVNVKDAYQDARFDPSWDAESGFRTTSMLCQPVFDRDGELVAVVQVLNKRQGYFTVEDESLLQTIMAMAAISIVNSQLTDTLFYNITQLKETRAELDEKVREIDLLYELERHVSEATDVEALARALVERVHAAVPSSLVQIALVPPSGPVLAWRIARGDDQAQPVTFERVAGLTALALHQGDDLNVCLLEPQELLRLATEERLPFLPAVGVCLPLEGPDGRLGTLAVYDRAGRHGCMGDDDLKLLSLVRSQVARAVVRLQAREQAEREDRLAAVGRALAGVLHDFRTPMTIASGYVQLLKSTEDAAERADLADSVLQQLDRMMQMTREVLAFARGEQTLLVRKVMLGDLTRDIEALVRQVFLQTPVKVEVRCGDRGMARLDASKLLRVVQNIARNARDALQNRPQPRFWVDVESEGGELVFTFADNGAGVPMDFRHRMFDAFATQGKKDGTGLGLAMVKQAAEAHGGSVTYRDTPGGGATFVLRLPRETAQPSGPVPQPLAMLPARAPVGSTER